MKCFNIDIFLFLRKRTHLDGIVTGVEMLKDFRDDLSLRGRILFPHGAIHEFRDVSVEMSDEVLKIFLVSSLIQSFPTDPLHRISKHTDSNGFE